MGIQNLGALLLCFGTFYTFFLKFWAVKICGLQFFWYSKYVGIQSVDDQIL